MTNMPRRPPLPRRPGACRRLRTRARAGIVHGHVYAHGHVCRQARVQAGMLWRSVTRGLCFLGEVKTSMKKKYSTTRGVVLPPGVSCRRLRHRASSCQCHRSSRIMVRMAYAHACAHACTRAHAAAHTGQGPDWPATSRAFAAMPSVPARAPGPPTCHN